MARAVLFVAVEGAPAVFRKLIEALGSGVRPLLHGVSGEVLLCAGGLVV